MIRKILQKSSLFLLLVLISCGDGSLGNKEFLLTSPDDPENYMVLVLLIDENGTVANTDSTTLAEATTFNLSYTDIPQNYSVTALYYTKEDLAGKKIFEVSATEFFGSEYVIEPRFYSNMSLNDTDNNASGEYIPAGLSGYLKHISKRIKFVEEGASTEVATSEAPVLEFVYPYPETSLSATTTELTLRGKNFLEGIKIEILDITIQEVVRYDTLFLTIILREPLGNAINELPLILIMQNPESASVSYHVQ